MQVYQTDHEGFFVGVTSADPDPLTKHEWLIPGGCVTEPPPELSDGERARWSGEGWEIVPPPEPPPEPPEPTPEEVAAALQAQFQAAIEDHVEQIARTRQYSSAVSLASYVASTNEAWAAEAQAFVAWRDAVWAYALAELAKVQAGDREVPELSAFIAELPPIEWP